MTPEKLGKLNTMQKNIERLYRLITILKNNKYCNFYYYNLSEKEYYLKGDEQKELCSFLENKLNELKEEFKSL